MNNILSNIWLVIRYLLPYIIFILLCICSYFIKDYYLTLGDNKAYELVYTCIGQNNTKFDMKIYLTNSLNKNSINESSLIQIVADLNFSDSTDSDIE